MSPHEIFRNHTAYHVVGNFLAWNGSQKRRMSTPLTAENRASLKYSWSLGLVMSFTVEVVWRVRNKSTQALRIVRSISAAHPSQVGHISDGHGSQNDRRDRHDDVQSSHFPSFEPSPRFTLNKTAYSTVLSQSITNHAFFTGFLSLVTKTRCYLASANGNGQSV